MRPVLDSPPVSLEDTTRFEKHTSERLIVMRKVKTALIGAGFVGPHHIEAVRRLGFVDVIAVAGSSKESSEAKAARLNIPKAYGSYLDLLSDPEIEVIHNCTPNDLHMPVTMAAIEHGKHVIADKP